MADAEESNRRRYFTTYCPLGHLCNLGGKHLKYSKTLSEARRKLAQHLHDGMGHSSHFDDWECCLTFLAAIMPQPIMQQPLAAMDCGGRAGHGAHCDL